MNRETLLAAFGEIDDKFFGEQWEQPAVKAEENTIEPVFTESKSRKRKKPLIVAASAVAACGVFAAGLGIALNMVTDTPPIDFNVRVYDSSEIFPDIKFTSDYKTMYNAEDIYDVEKIQVDPDIINKYGPPQLVTRDELYFTTDIGSFYRSYQILYTEPRKSADIIVYDIAAKEEKVIYSCGKQRDGDGVNLNLWGIYDNYMYFCQSESIDDEMLIYCDICRLNLDTLTLEIFFSHCINDGMYNENPVLSKSENCIYFYEYDNIESKQSKLYRYDITSGETELFIEGIQEHWAYKDGIIYIKDGNIYFHTGGKEDTVVSVDDYEEIKAYGGEFFTYMRYMDKQQRFGPLVLGLCDRNGEKELITDIQDETYHLWHTSSTEDFLTFRFGKKPLLYDYEKDIFFFIDTDRENFGCAAPSFGDKAGNTFCGYNGDAFDGYTSFEIVTITKNKDNSDNVPVTEKQEENLLSKYELYTTGNTDGTIQNSETLYTVERQTLYTQIPEVSSVPKIKEAFDSIYSNRFYGGGMVYLNGTDFYFTAQKSGKNAFIEEYDTTPAQILLYNTENGGITVVAEEMPQEEQWGLMLKITGIIDGYVYYYKIELPQGIAEEPSIISLWRISLESREKEKIFGLECDHYLGLYPVVKGGDYIYFSDYMKLGDIPTIYRYSTKTHKTEVVQTNAYSPRLCSYKDSVIYYSPADYYCYVENGEEKALCPSDFAGEIDTLDDDTVMYALPIREDDEEKTVLGIFDENLAPKELGKFPTGEKTMPEQRSYILGTGGADLITGGDGIAFADIQFGNDILLYDKEKDLFSQIDLSADAKVICCCETEKGLAFIIAEGLTGNSYRDCDFNSIKLITVTRPVTLFNSNTAGDISDSSREWVTWTTESIGKATVDYNSNPVDKDQLVLKPQYAATVPPEGDDNIYFGEEDWNSYSLSFDFYMEENTAIDFSIYSEYDYKCCFILWSNGMLSQPPLGLYRQTEIKGKDGGYFIPRLQTNMWHNIELKPVNSKLILYFDGKEMGEIYDLGENPHGRFSLSGSMLKNIVAYR